MNKKETAQVLAILRTTYPNTKIENAGAMTEAWYMCLGDLSAESVMKAARLHMETSKFFPTPAEIREKLVRAELVYRDTEIDSNRLEAGIKEITPLSREDITEAQLESLCEWIGFGYPNDIED